MVLMSLYSACAFTTIFMRSFCKSATSSERLNELKNLLKLRQLQFD